MATTRNNNLNAKLVLLGDMGAGKSSLALRFVKGQFNEFQESTIGAAFFSQTLALPDSTVKLEIWDTAGQDRYRSLAPMYYRGAAAGIVVYDITRPESFQKARNWVQELRGKGNVNMVTALVGNKSDLEEKRKVAAEAFNPNRSLAFQPRLHSYSLALIDKLWCSLSSFEEKPSHYTCHFKFYFKEAHAYANENGLFFLETSAKTAINVNDVFYEIARRLPGAQLAPNRGMILDDKPEQQLQSWSCCY